MMSIYTPLHIEIAQYLVGELAFGALGAVAADGTVTGNVWIGEMPQEVVDGLLLTPVPSPPAASPYIDHKTVAIDFWYRSNNSARAYSQLQAVYMLFDRREQYYTASWNVFLSQCIGDVQDASFDNSGGKLLRLSIQFLCRNIGVIS